MVISIREFNVGLYREHLEEASFLYDQRLSYLDDPDIDCPHARGWEERFEAHIDALVLGGESALNVCRQQASTGDAGQMHAALRVMCRQNRREDLVATLARIDASEDAAVRA